MFKSLWRSFVDAGARCVRGSVPTSCTSGIITAIQQLIMCYVLGVVATLITAPISNNVYVTVE